MLTCVLCFCHITLVRYAGFLTSRLLEEVIPYMCNSSVIYRQFNGGGASRITAHHHQMARVAQLLSMVSCDSNNT